MNELKPLLPCPFCGNSKKLTIYNADDDSSDEVKFSGFAVVCDSKNDGCGGAGGYFLTTAEAITAWNRREGG